MVVQHTHAKQSKQFIVALPSSSTASTPASELGGGSPLIGRAATIIPLVGSASAPVLPGASVCLGGSVVRPTTGSASLVGCISPILPGLPKWLSPMFSWGVLPRGHSPAAVSSSPFVWSVARGPSFIIIYILVPW